MMKTFSYHMLINDLKLLMRGWLISLHGQKIYSQKWGNWIFLACALILLSLTACDGHMRKYDWLPTECAPENYPIMIYGGTILYGDEGSIYIPDGKIVQRGWGSDGSTHVAGDALKEAPKAIDLKWISYAEKKNYSGHFLLETEKIDQLFQHGYEDIHLPNGRAEYNRVKVGMAPGGVVVVWVAGAGNMVEVGRFQAKEVADLDWKQKFPTMEGTMKEFSDTVTKALPDTIKQQIANHKIPFGLWDKWRQRFDWKSDYAGFGNIHEVALLYFNKEEQWLYQIQTIPYEQRAPIEKLDIFWTDNLQREIRTEIKFDEDEVFNTFGQAGNEQATLLVTLDSKKNELLIRLKLKDKELPFKKFKFKNYYR